MTLRGDGWETDKTPSVVRLAIELLGDVFGYADASYLESQ